MNPRSLFLTYLVLAALLVPISSFAEEPPIDPVRGHELMQKSQRGETLTADEQAYLERVKQAIRERIASRATGASAPGSTPKPVIPNTADWSALVPITDLTAPYKGEDGGLYGGGRNDPPEAHRVAHLQESAKIRPLNAAGEPSADGKIGLITIGFSNTSIESEDFKRTADADPQKSPLVTVVNGAIGGRSAVMWAWDGADVLPAAEQQRLDQEMDLVQMPKGIRKSTGLAKDTWPTLAKHIEAASLSPQQVQVVWLKHVEANPKPLGEFPAHARALQADITAILQIARHYYPNLRIAYLSSRTFGGWSGRESGSPEPYAYESGFGTRWVVQSQIAGDAALNFDPSRGEVKAPLILWGPYLWACGNTARKLDGLTWTLADVRADQLHPNDAGTKKTTALLLNFFKTNEGARQWFLKPGETAQLTPLPH
ncbi:MAG: hypothetical protein P4L99_17625 [Chthoniobacter sp.]|nr:hypothetical protein [Chthoniobacter sp.]